MARKPFTAGLVALVLALGLAAAATAGPFEDGVAAYGRGDYAASLRLMRPLAEVGNPSAQAMLGLMYALGRGVKQDYAVALRWYQKAADQGLASAQSDLGSMYDQGFGVKQDYAAVSWYRQAAERGYPDAQYYLGTMYESGKGVPQDYVMAHMWLSLAAATGNQDALHDRYEVERRMTPAQISEAQKVASEWKPRPN